MTLFVYRVRLLLVGPGLAVAAFALAWTFLDAATPSAPSPVEQTRHRTLSADRHPDGDAAADEPAVLLALGDVMLGRYVETLMEREGSEYPFRYLDDLTKDADLTFANLEGPVPDVHRKTPNGSLRFSFPPNAPSVLREHGVDAVSLANNHTADQGEAGYEATRRRLDEAGVASFGHPLREDGPVVSTVVRGQRVTLLGFHAPDRRFSLDGAVRAVQRARAEHGGFVVAAIHWGAEYAGTANATQRALGRALVDGGADLVLGHHPHVVQDVERYRDRLIVFSLGNAIFDQYFSSAVQEELAVRIMLTASSVRYELLPLTSVRSQPKAMEGVARASFLATLAGRSDPTLSDALRDGMIMLAR